MIIIYTGNGKGKTTAALGLALRGAGWGKKVAIIQFIKGYKDTGEWKMIKKIPEIDIFQTHNDKISAIGKPEEKHKKPAVDALKLAEKIIRMKKYEIIILDEINNAIDHHLVEAGKVMEILKSAPVGIDFVLTGRNAKTEIIADADLVTEMKLIKHPFNKGIMAKKGIDF